MSDITINIEGQKFDLDDFELGELEWLEEYLDAPLSDDGVLNRMKTAVGFVYLVKKRDDPTYTIEKARKIKLSAIDAGDDEPEPAAKRPPKRAARS